ncbi:hypothetical protein GYMLUDRAFT_394030 [Collybiopsis luxurians FD-317 M1]|uniref:Uncharacterized protein n=1 Tax=Collybiopsis luxurians FD-317 M1 TaxID=944289 RepID=A0A0D0C9M8_9AGAR|nr:hypothetical protein GYMLUDRAFT_394030 [Collybiopsis luxurians FD-317 M1]
MISVLKLIVSFRISAHLKVLVSVVLSFCLLDTLICSLSMVFSNKMELCISLDVLFKLICVIKRTVSSLLSALQKLY